MSCSSFFHSFFVTVIVKCTPVINYKEKRNLNSEFCNSSLLLGAKEEMIRRNAKKCMFFYL